MSVSANVMIRRTDSAPDNKRILLHPDTPLDEVIRAAATAFLQMGALVTKDAARKYRQTLQYQPGQANQPPATSPFGLWNTADINGENVQQAEGGYILTLCAEAHAFRYTLSGKQPSSTFGMLVPTGTFIDLVVQDLGSLQLCATVSGTIINIEIAEVDA